VEIISPNTVGGIFALLGFLVIFFGNTSCKPQYKKKGANPEAVITILF